MKRIPCSRIVMIFFLFVLPISMFPPMVSGEEVKEIALDFDDVDIRLFIRVISELTGKNFIIDNRVRGKITVLSPKKLTTQQAYDVFKSVLSVNGFTLVESGETIKIVPDQNMSGYELPLSKKKVLKGDDQYITQVIPLKYLDATPLIPLLKPLLSKQGYIIGTPSADILIVADTRSNIKKIDNLLDEIDIDLVDQLIDKLDLRYSSATIAASHITEILNGKYAASRKGARPAAFKIIPVERINALFAVSSSDIMMDIRSILSKIDQPTPEGKSMLHVYYLENADAEELVKVLTQTQRSLDSRIGAEPYTTARPGPQPAAAQAQPRTEGGGAVVGGQVKAMGKEVSITADKNTNSLIIYAMPEDYTIIYDMIKKLDIPRKQVFIETLIMEVSPSEKFSFGTEWNAFKDVGSIDGKTIGVLGGALSSGELNTLIAGSSTGGISLGNGFSLGLLGESLTVGNFTFPNLSILIRAVETLRTVEVLSKPQLMTLNNQKAKINISENRPFETSTTTSPNVGVTQNIEYRDVGIILTIVPHINQLGKIRLEVSQEVSTLSGTGTGDRPITLKRAIDTIVEVENGQSIVIGGLIQKQKDFSKGATPCVGNVPFMGWAFKSVGVSDTRTNLMVFLSPRILDSPRDSDNLSIEKKDLMDEERNRAIGNVDKEKPWFMEHDPRWRRQQEQEKQ